MDITYGEYFIGVGLTIFAIVSIYALYYVTFKLPINDVMSCMKDRIPTDIKNKCKPGGIVELPWSEDRFREDLKFRIENYIEEHRNDHLIEGAKWAHRKYWGE